MTIVTSDMVAICYHGDLDLVHAKSAMWMPFIVLQKTSVKVIVNVLRVGRVEGGNYSGV